MKACILPFICFFSIALYGTPIDSIQDVLPFENPEYIGYRIAITKLSIDASKKGKDLKINYTAINTGRQDLFFNKKTSPPPSLVVVFDHSLYQQRMVHYAKEIRDAVIKSNFHLASGKVSKTQSIFIEAKSQSNLTEFEPQAVATNLENPRLKKAVHSQAEAVDQLSAKGKDNNALEENTYDANACSDLVFESIKILKQSKNKVTLEYTILNKGQGPASLINSRKQENKNMALQAHLSSRAEKTKGSYTFDGDFIKEGLDQSDGRLLPGERYTNTIKLNIQKMTKFTPFVVLEMDPFLAVYECDKKNNKIAIQVGEGINH